MNNGIRYGKEIKRAAKNLRQGGMSYGQISRELDVHKTTIMYWLSARRRLMQNMATMSWMKNHPERTREIVNRAVKKYQTSPHGKQKMKENNLKRYRRLRSNPVLWRKELDRHKIYHRTYRAKVKNKK